MKRVLEVRVDVSEINDLLLDVLFQACGTQFMERQEIDTQCLKSYEDACDYLTNQGYLTTLDGRIYRVKKVKS